MNLWYFRQPHNPKRGVTERQALDMATGEVLSTGGARLVVSNY